MDWQAALLENWPYKLAAFALALLLWFNVTSDEQQPQAVATRLEITVEDSGWVLVDAPDEVSTTFQGRRGDLLGFSFDPPVLRKVVEAVTDTVMRVDLSPQDVTADDQIQARPISVQPSAVEARFERVVDRRIPVRVDVQATAASGHALVGSPQVRPESVTVRGARSQVRSLDEVSTEAIVLEDVEETVTRELALRLPSDRSTLRLDSARVLVTVTVDSLVERRLTVPVHLRGGGSGLRSQPPAVAVTVRGPRRVLGDLSADDVTAAVDVPPGEPGGADPRRLPVQVTLPEGVSATATADPATITISSGSSG